MDDPPDGLVVGVVFVDEPSFVPPESPDEVASDFLVPAADAVLEVERESVR